jgi:hypothetical protein
MNQASVKERPLLDFSGNLLSYETFAAKDSSGRVSGLFLVVPPRCGLKQADSLRVDGNRLLALCDRSVLPLDFADLTPSVSNWLADCAKTAKPVAVAEFTALGLLDAYFLDVVVIH